jgi:2-oxo-4-hydroxy-4-carboxy-5-ureidoimidazoline decarboxylase
VSNVLFHWNLLPPDQAASEILPCCGSRAWAQVLAGERPFQEVAALLAASDRIWSGLSPDDWSEAFASHPRIGTTASVGKSSAPSLAWSAREQSDALTAADSIKLALAEANREYESKFRRIFITCATGKSAAEILENLQRRLNNEEPAEILEAAEQQRQITQLRLRKWLGE